MGAFDELIQGINDICNTMESMGRELEEARAENERLREALEPFVKHYEQIRADDYRGCYAIVRTTHLKSAWKVTKGHDND